MIVPIESIRDVASGQVALLGGGESVNYLDLEKIERRMPVIGLNQSWKSLETPWRVFIHGSNWTDIKSGKAPKPKLAIFPVTKEIEQTVDEWVPDMFVCPLQYLVPRIKYPGEAHPFAGDFSSDLRDGTRAAFCGLLALEIAVWAGFTDIYLLGYDSAGGHFFDPKFSINSTTFEYWNKLLMDAGAVLKARGVRVTNCSGYSTVDAFQKGQIQ
jgi:hypothetical protein